MLPIRVINSGAARALKYVADKGWASPWIEAFAFDLEAARDIFTAHVRREVRPRVDALAKNRHFFAVEAIEAIFMQLFLLEVRKRTDTPSIIWLHDGLWIGREVDDQILYAAESHVRRLLFPISNSASSLFSIVDLHEAWQRAVSTCPPPPHPLFFFWMLHGSTKVVVRAVALLSAKTKDKVANSLKKCFRESNILETNKQQTPTT